MLCLAWWHILLLVLGVLGGFVVLWAVLRRYLVHGAAVLARLERRLQDRAP